MDQGDDLRSPPEANRICVTSAAQIMVTALGMVIGIRVIGFVALCANLLLGACSPSPDAQSIPAVVQGKAGARTVLGCLRQRSPHAVIESPASSNDRSVTFLVQEGPLGSHVTHAAWSPDGLLLAWGLHDGRVVVTPGDAGPQIAWIGDSHATRREHGPSFNPSGTAIVDIDPGESPQVLDLARGARVTPLAADHVVSTAWDGDDIVVTLDWKGGVGHFEARSGRSLGFVQPPEKVERPMELSADGAYVAARTPAGVLLWETRTGRPCGTLAFVDPGRLAWSGEGSLIAVGRPWKPLTTNPATLQIFSTSSGEPQPAIGIDTAPMAMRFLPGDEVLAVDDHELLLSNPRARFIKRSGSRDGPALASRPDGSAVFLSSDGPYIRTPSGERRQMRTGGAGVERIKVAYSPDGMFALAYGSGVLELWNAATQTRVAVLQAPFHGAPDRIFFTPRGTVGYVTWHEALPGHGDFKEWSVRDGRLVREHRFGRDDSLGDEVWASGCFAVHGHDERAGKDVVAVYDAATKRVRGKASAIANVLMSVVSPNCDLVVQTTHQGHVAMFALPSGAPRWSQDDAFKPTFRPRSDEIAFVSDDGVVTLCDVLTGKSRRCIPSDGEVAALAFASDGSRLLIVSRRHPSAWPVARIFDLHGSVEPLRVEVSGFEESVDAAAWTTRNAVAFFSAASMGAFIRPSDGAVVIQRALAVGESPFLAAMTSGSAIDVPPSLERFFPVRHGSDLRKPSGYSIRPIGPEVRHPGLMSDLLAGRPVSR